MSTRLYHHCDGRLSAGWLTVSYIHMTSISLVDDASPLHRFAAEQLKVKAIDFMGLVFNNRYRGSKQKC